MMPDPEIIARWHRALGAEPPESVLTLDDSLHRELLGALESTMAGRAAEIDAAGQAGLALVPGPLRPFVERVLRS